MSPPTNCPIIAKRRNKWICALKTILSELNIYGPAGGPELAPPVTRYTQVPWEQVQANERKAAKAAEDTAMLHGDVPTGGWRLSDKNAALR